MVKLSKLALLLSLVSAGACGPFHKGGPTDPVIIFSNDSPDQADVYAVSGGAPVRIGTVFAGRKETLKVPLSVVGGTHTVDIVVRIFATNRSVHSGSISLNEGDRVDVRLQPDEKLLSVLPAASP
jgi:hypothetical protein